MAATGYFPEPGDLQSLFYVLPEGAAPDQKRILVITVDGVVVGLVDALIGWPTPGTGTSGLFLIHPSRQRRGIGAEALDAVQTRAREAGMRVLRATCPRGWSPGERFLAGHGFTRQPASRPVSMNRVTHANEAGHPADAWTRQLSA
ncbi:MAG: GNAT family N-acetyltransferase [Actinomycetia bacterium]|nr:GNAT family N-acetyltransferase [Actinomycetes bacterium]